MAYDLSKVYSSHNCSQSFQTFDSFTLRGEPIPDSKESKNPHCFEI